MEQPQATTDYSWMITAMKNELRRISEQRMEVLHTRFDELSKSLTRDSRSRSHNRSNHDTKEEMDHYNALCTYDRYKHTGDEYEKDQRSPRRTSEKRSSSTKLACSFERSHDHIRAVEYKSSPRKREKGSLTPISSKSKAAFESSKEESWGDIYQRLLQEKQKKKPVERVELEEVVIEAEEWEENVESDYVQSVNDKESALCSSDKMSEKSLEIESMVVKAEGNSGGTYLPTNSYNFALFSASCLLQVTQGEVKMVLLCTIAKPFDGLSIFQGVAKLYPQSMEKYIALARQPPPFKGSLLSIDLATEFPSFTSAPSIGIDCLNDFDAPVTPYTSDLSICDYSCHDSSSRVAIVQSHHHVLSPYDSFNVLESRAYCISLYHSCLASASNVSLDFIPNLLMEHGTHVFPTCYTLGECRDFSCFIPTNDSCAVFDPGIDSRSKRLQGGSKAVRIIGAAPRVDIEDEHLAFALVRSSLVARIMRLRRRHVDWIVFMRIVTVFLVHSDLRTNPFKRRGLMCARI